MKKYLFLFSFTTIILIGLILLSSTVTEKVIPVGLIKVSPSKAESIVMCSGKIEYSKVNSVRMDESAIIEEIKVEVGDRVEKGMPLFKFSGAIEGIDLSTQNQDLNFDPQNFNNSSDLYNTYKNLFQNPDRQNLVKKNYVSDGKIKDFKSPYSGVLSSIQVKPKDVVNNETCVCTISSNDQLQVKAKINEAKVSDVKVGQRVIISGNGFKNSEYQGHVSKISNEATQILNPTGQETVVELIILIDSEAENVKPGFTAKCKIVTEEKNGVIIIPYESVKQDKQGRDFVYTFSSQDNKAVKTFINLGRDFENGVEVISGLTFEDRMVTDPESVCDGEKILLSEDFDENNRDE